MKLWILRRVDGADWDEAHGVVVRAEDELSARLLAASCAGGEGAAVWHKPDITTCVHLQQDGMPGVMIVDFKNG